MGAVEHLPPVLALAMIEMASSQPTWRELRKVAGSGFEFGTFLPSAEAAAYADLILANRDNVLRWLDTYASTLASIRQAIAAGDAEGLADRFASALQERQSWTEDRARGTWEGPGQEMPERPNMFVDTFLGGLGRRRKPKDE
jgi:3-phosphoshikimate 1-carboxyvinyltransferase